MEIIQTDPSSRGIYSERELFVASRVGTGILPPVYLGQGKLPRYKWVQHIFLFPGSTCEKRDSSSPLSHHEVEFKGLTRLEIPGNRL